MEIKITEQKESPLFKRKEIVAEITSESSPKNSEVSKLIAEKLSVSEENIKLNGIYGKFGTHVFTVYANVYDSIQDKESTETKTKKEREAEKKAEEERLKAEAEERTRKIEETPAPTEETKAEAEKPAEENTEEVKPKEKAE